MLYSVRQLFRETPKDQTEVTVSGWVRTLRDSKVIAFIELNDGTFDGRIASGGGRMQITMDRYQANWGMVEKGWNIHVHGQGRTFASAKEAIETYRN